MHLYSLHKTSDNCIVHHTKKILKCNLELWGWKVKFLRHMNTKLCTVFPSIFRNFHLMRHSIRRKMISKCIMYLEKVTTQFINSYLSTIWRCQIGMVSSQHSAYYPCFTKQERESFSTIKCLKWKIPLTCWKPIEKFL